MGSLSLSLLFLHRSAVTLLKLRSGPSPWAAFWMNSCVHLCVCLCVRPINISTLPNSRCLYNTAVLPSSCLSLYLLDCFIEVHSDTLYGGGGGAGEGEDVFPNRTAQDISLHVSFSTGVTVIWALIYVLLWQRLTSFLTGSLRACTLGETTKAWVYRADEHHEGEHVCGAALPSLLCPT